MLTVMDIDLALRKWQVSIPGGRVVFATHLRVCER